VSVPYNVIVLGRPLFGIILAGTLAERAFRSRSLNELLWAGAVLGLLVGVLGLFAQSYIAKSEQLFFVIRLLPALRGFPGAEGGFNVNEIAGAMAWFAPLCFGIALNAFRRRHWLPMTVSAAAFCLLWGALFLGQSRFAILGVLPIMGMLVWLLLHGRARAIGMGIVLFFLGAQLLVSSNILSQQSDALQQRDEDSVNSRVLIWMSALSILRDHPLTGAGLNNFRFGPVRDAYPVEGYGPGTILPHAHNEWLQAGADMGIAGVSALVALQAAALWMLWRVWKRGAPNARVLALATAGGLIAHMIYGLGDAIPLWDRLAFGLWWMLGMAAALYVLHGRADTGSASMNSP
jgi:O-antigen ligase